MCFAAVSAKTENTARQAFSEEHSETEEDRIKEKPRNASTSKRPGKKPKQKSVKSPKRGRKASKVKQVEKEGEDKADDTDENEEMEEEEDEEVVEEEDQKETKTSKKKETRVSGFKRRDLVVGECREEKAPYVKVREARMVTLADKVSTQEERSCIL